MAEIMLAYCSSHAPMMSAARQAAPKEQGDRFFGALDRIREQAAERGVQACAVGDIEEEFDRRLLERLERGGLDQVLDMPDSEIELAGNGNHEMRSWLAVAGAVAPVRSRTLAYEPIYPWIMGMAVAEFETAGKEWT